MDEREWLINKNGKVAEGDLDIENRKEFITVATWIIVLCGEREVNISSINWEDKTALALKFRNPLVEWSIRMNFIALSVFRNAVRSRAIAIRVGSRAAVLITSGLVAASRPSAASTTRSWCSGHGRPLRKVIYGKTRR